MLYVWQGRCSAIHFFIYEVVREGESYVNVYLRVI